MFYLLFSFQLWPFKTQCFQSEWHILSELQFSITKRSTFFRKRYHSPKDWRKKVVRLWHSWSLFCSSNEVGHHCSTRRWTGSFSSTFFSCSVCWIICLWSHHGIYGCYCSHLYMRLRKLYIFVKTRVCVYLLARYIAIFVWIFLNKIFVWIFWINELYMMIYVMLLYRGS